MKNLYTQSSIGRKGKKSTGNGFLQSMIAALFCLYSFGASAQHNNVFGIVPAVADVCVGTELSVAWAGQSFTPVSYLWSTGETTSTIIITQPGTYSVTITGYMGNGNRMITLTRTRTYSVLQRPQINVVNGPWVCKDDTVHLTVEPGYDAYVWNNGTIGTDYLRRMNSGLSGAVLDTATVTYTATIKGVCSVESDPIIVRGIRKPELGSLYCGNMDLSVNDSVRIGLVIPYLYPVSYDIEFTQINNTSNVITATVSDPKRWATLSALTPGENYYVRTRPVINGVTYCWGDTCEIGISTTNRESSNFNTIGSDARILRYDIYTVDGKLMASAPASQFSQQWFRDNLTKGFYVVVTQTDKGTGSRKLLSNYNF